MRVFVEYSVPVYVEVDLAAGVVVSVRVNDDHVDEPKGVIAEREIGPNKRRRAVAIAEQVEWPHWTFGV